MNPLEGHMCRPVGTKFILGEAEATIFAKTLEKITYFSSSLPLPPYNVGFLCDHAVR